MIVTFVFRKAWENFKKYLLREKYSNAGFFLVCNFPNSDWMPRFALSISELSSNTGKHRLEKTPYLHAAPAVHVLSDRGSIIFTFFTFS